MARKKAEKPDLSTEEKIKEAARSVFLKKGFAATRTRDIADEAGINLALLNYYFRSKEKLFQLIMTEKIQTMFGGIYPIMNDPSTKIETKIERMAEMYMTMLLENPEMPLFILSELRSRPEEFHEKVPIQKILIGSVFIKQLKEKRPDINPLHFILNMMGMMIFPFIAKPVFSSVGVTSEKEFQLLMQERKQLVPMWIKTLLKAR